MLKIFTLSFLSISILLSYEVGETVTSAHQNMDFSICYGHEHDPNNDGVFNFVMEQISEPAQKKKKLTSF